MKKEDMSTKTNMRAQYASFYRHYEGNVLLDSRIVDMAV